MHLPDDIKTVGVAGAGTMGAGIAQLFAAAGCKVLLYDLNETALQKALEIIAKNLDGAIKRNKLAPEDKIVILQRIGTIGRVEDLQGELILEAIVEKLEPKIALFRAVAAVNSQQTILATNTSSIPISRIAAQIPQPKRVAGMHFFNPAHIMKLVEIVSGIATHSQVAKTLYLIAQSMGKTAVYAKDAPGFIVNRVARHFYTESLKLAEEQAADFATIDALVENCGFRMGPFKLMDLIGVDTNFSVTSSMFESFHYEARFRPSRLQRQMTEAGLHGRKTGKGFYEY